MPRLPASLSPIKPLSRRSALKLGALAAAAVGVRRFPTPRPPAIAAAWPLSHPHVPLPDPEQLLAPAGAALLAAFDLLLTPAYVAASLIRRGAARPLDGTGRASPQARAVDPAGAFTLPSLYAAAGIAPSRAVAARLNWPRLVVDAALLRRGYPVNDTHPARLAQAEEDLRRQPPETAAAAVPFPLRDAGAVPPEGALLIEFDWLIPAAAPHPEAALEFLSRQAPAAAPDLPGVPLVPLAPLPLEALSRRREIVARLKRGA